MKIKSERSDLIQADTESGYCISIGYGEKHYCNGDTVEIGIIKDGNISIATDIKPALIPAVFKYPEAFSAFFCHA